ncbi:MAG: hypothetical protein FJX77_08995, partial [Armatimonadetes bacterium]|nr:hypothetical protein [Armatimonadota bacterium]
MTWDGVMWATTAHEIGRRIWIAWREKGFNSSSTTSLHMCSPTRAALLSGRYWSRFGVTSAQNERVYPFETVTLPRALQASGYATALCGKWHLGSRGDWGPNRFGFDHSYGSLAGGVGPYLHQYKRGPFEETWHRNHTLLQEKGHVTDLITQEAVNWLGRRDARPFFLYVAY